MEDGPPRFPPGFTCPVVLRIPPEPTWISLTGLSPCFGALSRAFLLSSSVPYMEVLQPQRDESPWFGLVRVRSPLLAESLLISFPLGTEMFHFPRLTSRAYVFSTRWAVEPPRVSPFGHSRIKGCLAPPRDLSQLATSFIVSARQGSLTVLFTIGY